MTRGVAASDANIDLNAPFSGVLVLIKTFKLIHFNAVLSVHVSLRTCLFFRCDDEKRCIYAVYAFHCRPVCVIVCVCVYGRVCF